MNENLYVKKKQLLEEMKVETLLQLQHLQEEEAEQFLERVEKCERIIHLIDKIDAQQSAFLPQQEKEFKEIISGIKQIREKIDPLLVPLYSKLQNLSVAERQKTIIRKGYMDEDAHPPSIFFDKKN